MLTQFKLSVYKLNYFIKIKMAWSVSLKKQIIHIHWNWSDLFKSIFKSISEYVYVCDRGRGRERNIKYAIKYVGHIFNPPRDSKFCSGSL